MRLERLTNEAHELYETALELYGISFPSHEQRESLSQATILKDDEYHFTLIYDGVVFVGLVLYWEPQEFIYVEHFCMVPEMRNKGYGQQVLELLSQSGKPLLLEIDPPLDPISLRRKGFYERSRFIENPYPHVHPPYHRGNAGHNLILMSSPDRMTQAEYDFFQEYLAHRVMDHVFS